MISLSLSKTIECRKCMFRVLGSFVDLKILKVIGGCGMLGEVGGGLSGGVWESGCEVGGGGWVYRVGVEGWGVGSGGLFPVGWSEKQHFQHHCLQIVQHLGFYVFEFRMS